MDASVRLAAAWPGYFRLAKVIVIGAPGVQTKGIPADFLSGHLSGW